MTETSVYNLYRTMEKENVLLSFKGVVTQELLFSVVRLIESRLELNNESKVVSKRLVGVLVECLQNLYFHAEDRMEEGVATKGTRSVMVLVVKENTGYFIRTGNYIQSDKVNELSNRLDGLNNMDKEELNEQFRSYLKDAVDSQESRTTGIGLIEIARKSSGNLVYDFVPVDQQTSFFCLNVQIGVE